MALEAAVGRVLHQGVGNLDGVVLYLLFAKRCVSRHRRLRSLWRWSVFCCLRPCCCRATHKDLDEIAGLRACGSSVGLAELVFLTQLCLPLSWRRVRTRTFVGAALWGWVSQPLVAIEGPFVGVARPISMSLRRAGWCVASPCVAGLRPCGSIGRFSLSSHVGIHN